MIRLTLIGERSRTAPAVSSAYFRIYGGAVWIGPGEEPLVRYVGPEWHYQGMLWPGMRFEGKCRVVFGLPRDPAGVSDLLQSLSIHDCTLSANGIPFAEYEPRRDLWRGAVADAWWHAFRIESAGLRQSATKPTLRGDVLQIPDPEEDFGDNNSLN